MSGETYVELLIHVLVILHLHLLLHHSVLLLFDGDLHLLLLLRAHLGHLLSKCLLVNHLLLHLHRNAFLLHLLHIVRHLLLGCTRGFFLGLILFLAWSLFRCLRNFLLHGLRLLLLLTVHISVSIYADLII